MDKIGDIDRIHIEFYEYQIVLNLFIFRLGGNTLSLSEPTCDKGECSNNILTILFKTPRTLQRRRYRYLTLNPGKIPILLYLADHLKSIFKGKISGFDIERLDALFEHNRALSVMFSENLNFHKYFAKI